jgi:hypothetical protein
VVVSWQAPVDNGGEAVGKYLVRLGAQGRWSNWSTITTPSVPLGSLRPRLTYTLEVKAVNSAGESPVAKHTIRVPR